MKSKIKDNSHIGCVVLFVITAVLFVVYSIPKLRQQEVKSQNKLEKQDFGQYVYLDRAFVLHTKNGCKAVYKDHNMQAVRPVLIDNVTRNNLDRICSQCVTEGQLDFMMGYLKAKEEVYELATDSIVDDYDPDTEP